MSQQPGLFDPADEGTRRRDAAIDQARDHAPEDWYRLANRAVVEVTRTHGLFTTDDVWAVLDRWDAPAPPEPRAMGAVMRDIGRSRVAVPTDRTRLSERPECHRRPLRVWRRL